MIIINVQLIFISWNALINLVAWLKINLWKEYILLLKWVWDKNSYDQTKINKKTYLKWKKFHRLIRLDLSSKLSSHVLSCYSKDLFNITCWMCNWKNYYVINCKNEKIKNRSKEFDANQVLIDSISHMSHFKISKKDKLSMNTSNHWEKNKKFSL